MIANPSPAATDAGPDLVELATAPDPPTVEFPQTLVPVPIPVVRGTAPSPARSEDLFAQLSTALTMKMSPAPDPRVDLRLSTALWLLTTVVGLGLWVYFSLHDTDRLTLIWFVAGLQIVLGLGWVVYRAGCRGPVRGVLALFPPVTLYRLLHHDGPDGYRPLRYVLTGVLMAGLPFVPLPTGAVVGNTLGLTVQSGPSDRPAESGVVQFRQIAERPGGNEPLRQELRRLTTAGPGSVSPADAAAMAAEFRKLLSHTNTGVKGDAARALVAWERTGARADVTALLKSPFQDDRATALSLLKTWPDAATARVAVGQLAVEEDLYLAKDALVEIGKAAPAVVEAVVIDALLSPSEQNPVPPIPLFELLELVGGEAAVDGLAKYMAVAPNLFLKDRAKTKKEAIELRLARKSGGK